MLLPSSLSKEKEMLLPLPKTYADLVYEEYDGDVKQAKACIRSFKLDKTWTTSVCAYLNGKANAN